MTGFGMLWLDVRWSGSVRQGAVSSAKTGWDVTWHGTTRSGSAWLGEARWGAIGQGADWLAVVRSDVASDDVARRGVAGLVRSRHAEASAWQGLVGQAMVCSGAMGQGVMRQAWDGQNGARCGSARHDLSRRGEVRSSWLRSGRERQGTVCNFRWEAPRYDVPTSVPVWHVCARPLGHDGWHECSCKAYLWQDEARLDWTGCARAGHGPASRGQAGLGTVRRGLARQGLARVGKTRQGPP